ncbi:hypothetical protein [Streptomyces noursei]|uniref:hypothetical protein n=1 Tax=Streptomyces noursei TaxID=1971 RepID=UPI0021A80AEE|nr:hypothetical protein [Streptomyces noursei]UWS77562.1 hypothetical protein N1H47_40860 [Streptomyces noursei]
MAYDRLLETLGRARRARLIPMEHIRDDRAEARGVPSGYEDPAEFFASVRAAASDYARPWTRASRPLSRSGARPPAHCRCWPE